MTVDLTGEELELFHKNGITDEDIQATVNRYRDVDKLDDATIRKKVDEKLAAFGGAIVTPEIQENGEIKEAYNYPSEHLEKGQVKKRGWFHPVDFAKSVVKGGIRGQTGFVAPITDRLENLGRRALGLRPLTEYEQENNRAKVIGRKEDGGAYNVGKFIGETAPYFVLPETKLAGLGKWGNRALTYGYQGGLGSGLSSIAEKGLNPVENLKDAAIGAGGAIVLGGALAKGGDKLARVGRAKAIAKRRATPLSERMSEAQKENVYLNRSANKRIQEMKENPDLLDNEDFYKGVENLSDDEQMRFWDEYDKLDNQRKVSNLKQQRADNMTAKNEEIARINAERQEALKGASFMNPSAKINERFDKQVRKAQVKYNKVENDLKGQIKELTPQETNLYTLKDDIGGVGFSKQEYTHEYDTLRHKNKYYRNLLDTPEAYEIKESMQKFNRYVQDIKNNPSLVDDEVFMTKFEQDFNAMKSNIPDYAHSEFDDKLNQLMEKARNYNEFKASRNAKPQMEQITESEYNAINNPVDDIGGGIGGNEPPITNGYNGGTPSGDKTSKFINTVDNSSLANETIKGQANATYKTISNKETLSKAQSIIDEDLQGAINKVLTNEKPSEVEIAMGEDLVRRLQATGNSKDTELAIQILEKTASDLTKAGRTVQAARIWQALTPEGSLMAFQRAIRKNTPPHIQSVLDNANGIINKIKTAQTSEEAEKILKSELRELSASAKSKITKELKNAYENGTVDVDTLKQSIEKHFKIKTMTADDTAELQQLVENIQLSKTDREREINTALLKRKIEEVTPASFGRKASTIQAGMQLLNPKTIIRNLAGNTGFSALEDVTQSSIAAPLDWIVSKATGQRSIVPTNLKTQGKGFIRGAKLGLEDIQHGIDTSANAGKYDLWGGRTFRDGGLGELIEKGMNYTLRVPDRAAYTAVYDEAIENMLRAEGAKKVTREMIDNAPQYIKDQANLEALERTFQDDSTLAKWGQGIKRGLNFGKDFGLGDLVLKYAKTPSNILQRGIDYSPIGGIKGLYELVAPNTFNPQMTFNQRQAVMDLARGLMGTGIIGAGAGLKSVFNGIQGANEDKARLRNNLLAQGNLPYSIPIGDKNYTFDWAVPTSIPLSAGINAIQNGGGVVENILGGMNTLAEQPLVQGLQKVAGGGFKSMPEGLLEVGTGALNSFYPSLLRQAAQVTNPYYRETKSDKQGLPAMLETQANRFINNVPIWNESLPIKYDVTGEPVSRGDTVGERAFNAFLNPANVAKRKNNKALDYSMDIYNSIDTDKKNAALYPIVPNTVKVDGQNIRLNKEQRSEYQKKLGRMTQVIRENLMNDEEFMQMTKEEQANEFDKYNGAINGAIKYKMFGIEPKQRKRLTNEILEYYDEY